MPARTRTRVRGGSAADLTPVGLFGADADIAPAAPDGIVPPLAEVENIPTTGAGHDVPSASSASVKTAGTSKIHVFSGIGPPVGPVQLDAPNPELLEAADRTDRFVGPDQPACLVKD